MFMINIEEANSHTLFVRASVRLCFLVANAAAPTFLCNFLSNVNSLSKSFQNSSVV